MILRPLIACTALAALGAATLTLPSAAADSSLPSPAASSAAFPTPTPENLAKGARTVGRAVVVVEGGGAPHAYTTPWDACDDGRPTYVQALVDAGLPVFTAPGHGNTLTSTAGRTGCPAQPPVETQWNTAGYPTQAGQAVLGFLGYLNSTYGYVTFDLVGYSYGGLVSRATIAALKQAPQAGSTAPAFSYATAAREAGITIPTLLTMNSPHLGAPSYDIASDPKRYFAPVARGWGREYAKESKSLVIFERTAGAGAIQVLKTSGHARKNPNSWDASQVGVLDGVAVTLVAGDYCGRVCPPATSAPRLRASTAPRTDGTVPVYSQLIQTCGRTCPNPPGTVYVPPGMVPADTVRKVFPTVHSTFDSQGLGLPDAMSVSKNPAAIDFIVSTVTEDWRTAGLPVTAIQSTH